MGKKMKGEEKEGGRKREGEWKREGGREINWCVCVCVCVCDGAQDVFPSSTPSIILLTPHTNKDNPVRVKG